MSKQRKPKVADNAMSVPLPVLEEAPPSEVNPAEGTAAEAQCGGCKHWLKLNDRLGKCRRYPPALMPGLALTSDGPFGIFPITTLDTSCGEHTPLG